MSRPMIHCPDCHRELYSLHRPQCLWCGARLTEAEFQQVAQAPGSPLPPLPQPMPFIPSAMGTPWFGRTWGRFNDNPFLAIRRSVSPWERRLRIVGAALFVCMMLAHFLHVLYAMWLMHQIMPLLHHPPPPVHQMR